MSSKVLCIAGPSGSGKTTLLERLPDHLPMDRRRVGFVKHTHHALDWHPRGKDSARLWETGAGAVLVVGPGQLARFTRADEGAAARVAKDGRIETRSLIVACEAFPDSIALVLAEGYGDSLAPKLWLAPESPAGGGDLPPGVRAIVTTAHAAPAWRSHTRDIPVCVREDVGGIASRVLEWAAPVRELAAGVRREPEC
ncbi:MAG: molybdopterin-guanine dinucleotide biosynthesis protein B [Gemmatimonadota bacterium]